MCLDVLTPLLPKSIVKRLWPTGRPSLKFAHESSELTDAVADIFCPSSHCGSPYAQPDRGNVRLFRTLRGLGRADFVVGRGNRLGGRVLGAQAQAGDNTWHSARPHRG